MAFAAKQFNQYVGLILVAVGLLDIVSPGVFGLLVEQTWLTRALHTLGGAYVAYVGFQGQEGSNMRTAQVLGVIALVAALLGFFYPSLLGSLSITDGTNFNIVHALIGLVGVYVGWMGKKA